jgi:hypothetical protein
VRIGTWNLAGRWSDDHRGLLLAADCDVWLLTEVNERTSLPRYAMHLSDAPTAARRRWATVASRLPMASSPDPHRASAAAQIGATTYVSSVLHWNHASTGREYAGSKAGRDAITGALDELGLVVAEYDGKRLSDHDAYVVDAQEA